METLPLHIEYLLTRHECVIVPGIGAFIVTEREACIDTENGIVSPRRREISFNSSVVTDDGLLSHSLARKEHLPYEVAHRRLYSLIEKMRSDLNLEGEVSLGMLGKLLQDAEGLFSFEPRKSGAMPDILSDIKLKPVGVANDLSSVSDTESSDEPTIESDTNDGMRTIKVSPDRYVFTIKKRVVHVAAMLVAIMTLGLSLMIPNNLDNEQKASVISFDDFFRRAVKTDLRNINASKDNNALEFDSIRAEKLTDTVR